jgi:hypothetical protein
MSTAVTAYPAGQLLGVVAEPAADHQRLAAGRVPCPAVARPARRIQPQHQQRVRREPGGPGHRRRLITCACVDLLKRGPGGSAAVGRHGPECRHGRTPSVRKTRSPAALQGDSRNRGPYRNVINSGGHAREIRPGVPETSGFVLREAPYQNLLICLHGYASPDGPHHGLRESRGQRPPADRVQRLPEMREQRPRMRIARCIPCRAPQLGHRAAGSPRPSSYYDTKTRMKRTP